MPLSWLYTLFLAIDANFRLKRKDRGVLQDPELGPGWAYMVNETAYQEELRKRKEEPIEVSSDDVYEWLIVNIL